MLVATPANPGMADRKPKVISGLRKIHVQRSPSLDGLPRLSGILNHYSELDEAWHLRWVVVRDGSLLVYSPDKDPRAQASATLSRLERIPNVDHYFPTSEKIPDRMMQSLDSSLLRNDTSSNASSDIGDTPISRHSSSKNLDQMLRRDQAIFDSAMTPFGTNSLGRNGSSTCARLPLRHLNLRPCELRPLAFSLSRRVEGEQPCIVAIFQAPSRRDYERWVKTLAVEILRQTPLDAVRFLDILGIAAFDDDKQERDSRSVSRDQVDSHYADHTPIRPARMSRKAMFANGDSKPESPKKSSPFDRSKSGSIKKNRSSRNRNSFRKKERVNGGEVARNLFNDCTYKIPILTCQSIVNHNNITTVTIGEMKEMRGRELFTPPYTEPDIHADEGIVVEISDDDLSSESDGKGRRMSEHSNCLDSPKSVTSHSSLGDSTTLSVDCVDSIDDRFIKINIPHAVSITKRMTEANKKLATLKGEECGIRAPWANRVLKPAGIDQLLAKDTTEPKKIEIGKSPQIFTGRWSWENSAIYNQLNPIDNYILRARSCSPTKKVASVPRRYASSCSRPGRISTGQLSLTSEGGEEMVQLLKLRCQSTDKYVPVKEKLALFETLSQVERRLARSNEDLLNKTETLPSFSNRAQSMHDLSKPDIPTVPVKEMCKFFENMAKPSKKTVKLKPTKTASSDTVYEKINYLMCKQIKNGNKIISFV